MCTTLKEDTHEEPKHDDAHYHNHNQLLRKMQDLPPEWTVIQITKGFNGAVWSAKNPDIISIDTGFHFTLFRYPRMKLNNNQPILISVPPCSTTMYKDLANVLADLKASLKYDKQNDSSQQRMQHWAKLKELNERLSACLAQTKDHFAGWLFLLAGEFTDKLDKKYEQWVFEKVDQYCDQHGRSVRDRILLSLIGRRIDLMTEEGIYKFICHIEKDLTKLKSLFVFLVELKAGQFEKFAFSYPCILIIDEFMDMIFWEMLNVDQGICRLGSFETLWMLWNEHKGRIRDGYLRVDSEKGFCVINPGKDLQAMELRMKEFVDTSLADSFTHVIGEEPDVDVMMNALTNCDTFVYCGHGNGLQYTRHDFLATHTLRCVAFLFGCGSIQLNSQGMWSEMKGSHMYYHAALW